MKRSQRRHHYQRMKKKARSWFGGKDNEYGQAESWDDETCARNVSNGKQCSDPYCCGNLRRLKGRNRLTRQELRAQEAAKAEEV